MKRIRDYLEVNNNKRSRTGETVEKDTTFQKVTTTEGIRRNIDAVMHEIPEGSYCLFPNQDIVLNISNELLLREDQLNFLSINTRFRALVKSRNRVILTGNDLLDLQKEKLQFARKHNFTLNIELKTNEDIEQMSIFMQNPDNRGLLGNLEIFRLPDIIPENMCKTNILLNFIADQCPNLMSFSCGSIVGDEFKFPKLNSLNIFSCKAIRGRFTLPKLENLTHFFCFDLLSDTILRITELKNLVTFSCKNIDPHATLILFDLQNLTSFLCGEIFWDTTVLLTELNNLISFSCENINGNAIVQFPIYFPKLQQIHFGTIGNINIRKVLENFKEQIQKR